MNSKKLINFFFAYTLVTFVIGLVMKLTLIGWQGDTIRHLTSFEGSDPDYNTHLTEAASGMGTQVLLVIATLIAYPPSIIKLWKMVANSNEQWTARNQKRFFIEYLIFLIAFIIIDLSGISIMIVEHAPMSNGWVQFALVSILFPTTFAVGSLFFLRHTKSLVVKPLPVIS